jgi:hypothetical protein
MEIKKEASPMINKALWMGIPAAIGGAIAYKKSKPENRKRNVLLGASAGAGVGYAAGRLAPKAIFRIGELANDRVRKNSRGMMDLHKRQGKDLGAVIDFINNPSTSYAEGEEAGAKMREMYTVRDKNQELIRDFHDKHDNFWHLAKGHMPRFPGAKDMGTSLREAWKAVGSKRSAQQALQQMKDNLPKEASLKSQIHLHLRKKTMSSNVHSVGYDQKARKLRVQFNSGGVYDYEDVSPETHAEFMAAPSKGKYLHQNIKGRYRVNKVPHQSLHQGLGKLTART